MLPEDEDLNNEMELDMSGQESFDAIRNQRETQHSEKHDFNNILSGLDG